MFDINQIKRVYETATPKEMGVAVGGATLLVTLIGYLFARNKIIKRALTELKAWKGMVESDSKAIPFLTKYWAAVNLPLQSPTGVPWSAAFISFLIQDQFNPRQSHIEYARAAYQDRLRGIKGKYWAYSPTEAGEIRRGDVLIKARSGSGATFQDVQVNTGFLPTHGDLVTKIKDGFAETVGGNVANAVSVTKYPLYSGKAPGEVFAVLRKS